MLDPMKIWQDHFHNCQQCKKAIKMRMAGAKATTIEKVLCKEGNPLFKAFIEIARQRKGSVAKCNSEGK